MYTNKRVIVSVFRAVFSLSLLFLSSWALLSAQYTAPLQQQMDFSIQANTNFLNMNQCMYNNTPIYNGIRLYSGDTWYARDRYLKISPNNFIDRFRFDTGYSSVTLYNNTNAIFQNLGGGFNIKSWGNPLQNQRVDIARHDGGLRVINRGLDTLQRSAQLVYRIHVEGLRNTNDGSINIPSYQYRLSGATASTTDGPYSNMRHFAGSLFNECVNVYVSYCGDGYLDSNGLSMRPGYTDHPISLVNTSLANEACDPGVTGSPSDDVFATVQPNGTTCSQTCTIILPQATQYVNPIVVKSQRNITRNTPTTGQYTTATIAYSSGNQIEYRVVISNPSTTLSTYTGISLREQLPSNFAYAITNPVTIVTSGVVTPVGVTYSTTTNQSSAFQLAPLASVTFFIRGILLTNSPITRTNIANLYVGNIEIDDSDVSMNYNTPLAPSLSIVKSQRIRPGATNYIMSGSLPNGPAFVTTPLTGNVGDMIDYRIRVINTGAGTAYLSTIVDNAINAGIPGLNCPVIAISNMYHVTSLPIITSTVYKVPNQALWTFNPAVVLQTNHEVNIYFSCAIITTRPTYSNHGSVTWSTGGAMTTTLSNTVIVTTPIPPLPSVTLNKEIKTGGMANYGQYEDGHNGALVVNLGESISYRITVTKSGSALSQVHLSDVRPSCFTPTSASINNAPISPFVSYNLNQLNVPGNVTVTVIINGFVPLSATGCGIERNTAFLSLPVGYPYTIIDPWGNQSGISTIAPIRDTADFQLAGYAPHVNLRLEKTVSPPFAEGNVENLSSQAGGLGWFTLTFGNTGNIAAGGVVINDTLPVGLSCIRYFVNGGAPIPCSGNNFSYTYGSLLPGSTGQISIEFIVNPLTNTTFFLNTGYLVYNNISLSDTASVTLLPRPGFTITKTVNTGVLISGQTLTYTIHFTNTGGQLSSYYIFDPLSPALTYVPNSATLNGLPRAPVQSGNVLFWGCNAGSSGTNLNSTSVCPLASGGSGTIVFQALVH